MVRSGAQTLVLLATPLNVLLLRALAERPKRQTELRRDTGGPAQSTLRTQLRRLVEVGALEKSRRNRFPGVLEYGLTGAGRDLLFVAGATEHWLADAPDGPLPLGDNAAKATLGALAAGLSTAMVRLLAAGPLSLTELDQVIAGLSYPALERRLTSMRLAGLVSPCPDEGRRTPYIATRWLREASAPIVAAIDWERRHRPDGSPPVGRLDVETAFLLALPLLSLPAERSGTCWMAAEIAGSDIRLAGVVADVRAGKVASCATRLDGDPRACIVGPLAAWLSAIVTGEARGLELDGDLRLAHEILAGVHEALFASNGEIHHPPLTGLIRSEKIASN